MKLVTNIQLGLKDQTIYQISEDGNLSRIAQVELKDLGDTLCGLYSTNNADEAIIRGPKDMALKVESQARKCYFTLFSKDDINITIYEEN